MASLPDLDSCHLSPTFADALLTVVGNYNTYFVPGFSTRN
ncbi:hypothetical protein KOR34_48890 [Posidoniimonas corsicana]|uniref:Uncharacterized protein n=1 Tax=Posidoniimonas corsicana TaxID=1938618 RepID=A0A5C5UVB7_9BACT|nr:hypothetical protein KOR34_48890 [Posidoniimonas corsicana]